MSATTLDFDLVSRVVRHPEELNTLLLTGLEARHIRDAAMRAAFEYVLAHKQRHRAVPSPATVERDLGFAPSDPPEPVTYYADQVAKREAFYAMRDGRNTLDALLAKGDVEGAAREIGALAKAVTLELDRGHEVSGIADVRARLDRYALAASKKLVGIPFPWKEYTDETMGWKPGEYGLVVARTGVGKTWFALQLASTAWMEGKRVLFFSMEMAPDLVHVRHDSLLAQVPFDALWKGTLTASQEKLYRETLDELKGYEGFNVVGYNMQASTLQMQALIEQYEPDFVICDGAYLMRPIGYNPRMSRTELLAEVANDHTRLANSYGIPVCDVVQFNRDQKKTKVDADVENIYGSDAWGQNATYVFALLRTKEDLRDGVMRASLIKHRNGNVFASRIAWDLDAMDFPLLEFEVGKTSLARAAASAAPAAAVTW